MTRRSGLLIAGGLAAASAVAACVAAFRSSRTGCYYPDGQSYCAMGAGHDGSLPYTRRPLVPTLVHELSAGSEIDRFRIVGLVALVATAVLVAFTTARLARALGAADPTITVAAVTAGVVVIAMPHGIRLAWSYPVFTDVPSWAFALAWAAGVTAQRRIPALLLVLAGATVCAREEWLLSITVASAWLLFRRRERVAALASFAGAVVGAGIDVLQPHVGYNYTETIHEDVRTLTHSDGLQHLLWSTVFVGAGLLVLAVWTAVRRRGDAPDQLWVLGIVAVPEMALSYIGGSDTPRLLAGGVVFLIPIALAGAAAVIEPLPAVVLLVASFALWRPWRAPHDPVRFNDFYVPWQGLPRHVFDVRRLQDLVIVAVAAAAVIVLRATRPDRPKG